MHSLPKTVGRAVFVVALGLASSFVDAAEAPLERSPGSFTQEDALYEAQVRYSSLVLDAGRLRSQHRAEVRLTDEARQQLSDRECTTCNAGKQLTRIGVNLPIERTVSLESLDPATLAKQSIDRDGGLARVNGVGQFVWTTSITSPEAAGMRINLKGFHLPAGLEMMIYNLDGEAFGPYTGSGPLNSGEFWTHSVAGETAYIEVRSQSPVSDRVLGKVRFTIAGVSHLGADADTTLANALSDPQPAAMTCPEGAPCFQDGSCYSTSDWAAIDGVRLATGHMRFTTSEGTFICSGGLVNDNVPGTFAAYFLTANHCFSTQAVAGTLEVFFRFQTPSCNAACPTASTSTRTLGATLLATSETTDFSFLLLSQEPPPGSAYLGWTVDPVANTNNFELYRLSHPNGAPQRYSRHRVDTSAGTCGGFPRGNYIYSRNTLGGVRSGSSGSPVLNVSGQIVGQLFGACGSNLNDFCDTTSNATVDGAFAVTYASISSFLQGTATTPTPTPTPTRPANDNVGNAITVTGASGRATGSNSNATAEPGELPAFVGDNPNSVWWRWTAPGAGTATVDTAGSSFDTVLGVWRGSGSHPLTFVGANDDNGSSLQSRVQFTATAGTTYFFQVYGYEGASGNITLNWAGQPGASTPTPTPTPAAPATINRQTIGFSGSNWWYALATDLSGTSGTVGEKLDDFTGDFQFDVTANEWYGVFIYDGATGNSSWGFTYPAP